jgi:hypothetical protein
MSRGIARHKDRWPSRADATVYVYNIQISFNFVMNILKVLRHLKVTGLNHPSFNDY